MNADHRMPTDPLDAVTLEVLQRPHSEVEKWAGIWQNLRYLFVGGEEFLRAAGEAAQTRAAGVWSTGFVDRHQIYGSARRRRFLHQLDAEPDAKYISRWEIAEYFNYFGAILNYFRHWLFSQPPQIRPVGGGDAPAWWPEFERDCTGGGVSINDFLKDAFKETLLLRRSGWLVGGPEIDPREAAKFSGQFLSMADAEASGLNRVYLRHFKAEEICNWQHDAAGRLMWVLLKKKQRVQEFPLQPFDVEVYTFVDRERWRSWQIIHGEQGTPAKLVIVGNAEHGLGVVPFVEWTLPPDLWIANSLYAPAISIFNRSNLLIYGMLIGCYPQPWMKSENPDGKSEIFGDAMVMTLRKDEDFGWKSPDVGPYKAVAEHIDTSVKEMYRIVHQLSLAVDATAVQVGQSGASKVEDRRAAEIILCAFGGYVRQVATQTLNLVSKIMQIGETGTADGAQEWTVEGFDNFQVSSLMEELQQATVFTQLDFGSPTLEIAVKQDMATGRLVKVDEVTRERIRQEIEESVQAKYAARRPPQVLPDGADAASTSMDTQPDAPAPEIAAGKTEPQAPPAAA